MKRKWKWAIGIVLVLLVVGGVTAGVQYNKRGIVTVQTSRVVRQDLSAVVTASGEIKPRNYINIGADVTGRITDLFVKEGDRVKKRQRLAQLENIQAQADVEAQKAGVNSALADSAAAEANVKAGDEAVTTAQATVERNKADAERLRQDFERARKLAESKLIAQQEFDQKKATYDAQIAAVHEAEARVDQAKAQRDQVRAQLNSAQRRVSQLQANLKRFSDVLDKYTAVAPIDGVVTNLPVHVGETVVPGIQNSAASTIMTIADMSIITAEVKVDETDIVNVKLQQVADITIDAMPNEKFKGHVIEIGNTAILRSTGLAASQSAVSSQEAKDFKVVVAMDNPPDTIRPGLSCTAKITTATRTHVLTIPIQALTVRQKGDLEPEAERKKAATQPPNPIADKARKQEIAGVFVVKGDQAIFRPVETGITGATDIEVTKGLNEGDEIITGTYTVVKTIRNEAKIKIDNKPPAPATK